MKLIQATIMGGDNLPFLSFQFGVSIQAESLLIGNLDWQEIEPTGPNGQPLPDWEAQQVKEQMGGSVEITTVDIPMMIALMENMPAAKEDYEKAKGSAYPAVQATILGALRAAEQFDHLQVMLVSSPIFNQDE